MVRCSAVRVFVTCPHCYLLHSVYVGQLLGCARKHIVNIMKVYIERNNMQVQLILFRKKILTLLTLETLKWETFTNDMFIKLGSLLSVKCRHRAVQLWNCTMNRYSWQAKM